MPQRLKQAGLLLWLAALAVLAFPPGAGTQGQSARLFAGPLVVTVTPGQDAFLLIDLATGEQRRLTFGPGEHYFGGFSPDGCEILFAWEHAPGQGDLFAARLDGSGLRRLLDLGPSGALSYLAWEPEWSPDGSRIVFTLIRYYDPPDQEPYRATHIAWVSPQGGRPNFYSNSGTEWQPRWSSDGRWLVYVSNQPVLPAPDATPTNTQGDVEGKPELWLVQADGQGKRRLTDFGSGGAFNPRWSPTNDLIAFAYQVMPNNHQIMVMPRDGPASPIIVNRQAGTVLDFVWEPTGKALIASVQSFDGEPRNVLWRLPFGQMGEAPPERLIGDPTLVYLDYPRFSADGRWLAFRQAYELVVYDTVLGTLQAFGPDAKNNNPPAWSPAGFQGEQACQ